MIRFYILSAYIFLSSLSFGQTDKNYDCLNKSNLTLNERLNFYPFNIAKQVMLVSFDSSLAELPSNASKIDLSKFKETKILESTQIDSLTFLLYNLGSKGNSFQYVPASCYFPKNAILFLDVNKKVVEYIEICFECKKTRESSHKVQNGISCNQKFDIIKSYFARQGIKHGIAFE